MSTFSQWWLGFEKKKEIRQVTWLCGTEPVLIEEVVSTIKKSLELPPWGFSSYVVGEDSERAIWADVDQHPVDDQPRLVLIRSAHKIKHWSRFMKFVQNRTANPKTYLLLVSDEPKIAQTEVSELERKNGIKPKTVPHLAALSGKGHVIECRPFTQDTAKHAVAWVKSKIPVKDSIAAHLLNRSDGDLRLVRDTCLKLALFPNDVTLSTINSILSERPRDSFTDALIALDKKTALMALAAVPEDEYSRLIGQLDATLDLAGMIHDMQLKHATNSDIARAAGTRAFLVKDILPVSKHYDAKRRLSIRKMLAVVDEAQRSGAKVGTMESVVMFW